MSCSSNITLYFTSCSEGRPNGPTYSNGTALIYSDWEWWFQHQFDDSGHATVQGDSFDPRLQHNISKEWQQSAGAISR